MNYAILCCDLSGCDRIFEREMRKIRKQHYCCKLHSYESMRSGGILRRSLSESSFRLPILDVRCPNCDIIFQRKDKKTSSVQQFCSTECVYESQKEGGDTYDLRRQRSLIKHGVDHPMKTSTIIERRATNNLEKYGVECTFLVPEFQEKIKRTNLDRYGEEKPSRSPIIQMKVKSTNLLRFGFDSPMKNPDILKKREETFRIRWGGVGLASPTIRRKYEETCLARYGNANVTQTDWFRSMYVETFMRKYGVDNPMKVKEFLEKAEKRSHDSYMMRVHGISYQEWLTFMQNEYEEYRRIVRRVTSSQPLSNLDDIDKRSKMGYHLDHNYSISQGFRDSVPPEMIGNIINLRMIPWKDNIIKGDKCDISLEEIHALFLEHTVNSL